MHKYRFVVLCAVLIGCLASFSGVANAESYQFMDHTFLETGGNFFSAGGYGMEYVEGYSAGSAAACVGARGLPETQVCGGENQAVTSHFIGTNDETYLHNHSTYNSYFLAWNYCESCYG
jgi:hypothetical protein